MILIRADANEHIGAGHLMRCLSIAHAFVEKGEKVCFITADHKGDKLLEAQGFHPICLETKWNVMEDELPLLKRILDEYHPSLLLIDSYYVTKQYMTALNRVIRTAYIDDINDRSYDTDYLINYNIYADSFDYSQYVDKGTTTLLGPQYVPLRTEFKSLPNHIVNKKIHNVFVSAGGSDPEHVTERMITGLCPLWPDVQFHFIIGSLNPRISTIKQNESPNITLHVNETHMSDVMRECDVAISAAGTTLYELCACGIPTIMYVLADNQINAVKEFASKGIMLEAGDCRIKIPFCKNIDELLRYMCVEKRQELSKKMRVLVDGRGAERIVERLMTRNTEIIDS